MDFIKQHKLKVCIIAFVLFFIAMISANVSRWNEERNNPTVDEEVVEDEYVDEEYEEPVEYAENEIEYLIEKQDTLSRRYGDLPEGFIWDEDGNLLSLGDTSKSAEESLYAYLNAVSSLDISTIQRYSRNSYVVKRYSGYFNATEQDPDYRTQFMRNMYRECMLSMQIDSVLSSSVFAENKVVFTVQVEILDLTDKDFWLDDKWTIYDNLHIYNLESDTTKSDMYLYDYILNYYRSDEASLRTAIFDITLERYSDVNSGWLVSIDSDVDDACVYRDGTLVVSYMKSMYEKEAVPEYERQAEEEQRAKEGGNDSDSNSSNSSADEYDPNYNSEQEFDDNNNPIDENGNIINQDIWNTDDTENDGLTWDTLG